MPSNHSARAGDPGLNPVSIGQAALLIASSDPELCSGLRTRLEAAGHDVRVVSSGDAALESALETTPSLIVLDAAQNDLDPIAVTSRIKSSDETRFLPLLLLTGTTDPASVIQFYQSGIDDVRTKPIDVDELAARIQAELKSRLLYRNLLDENREMQGAYATRRDSELLYHSLFSGSPLPGFAVNPDTFSIKLANEEAAVLTGYPADMLVGMSVASLCPGDSERNWLQDLCRKVLGGTIVSGETGSVINSDGRRIAVEAALSRVEYATDKVIALFLTDLSPRNKVQEARIDAERSNMLRETAIAVNSRINDPLFVILNDIGSLQMSLTGVEASVQSRLARVLEAAQRIQRVTAQLSAISSVVTKEYLPGIRMLDLDESVAASVDRISESDDDE